MSLVEEYDDLIFIEDYRDPGKILVARESWFGTKCASELYNECGILMDYEGDHFDECVEDEDGNRENCSCDCSEYRAHNFWNGRNFESIVLDETSCYSQITDTNRINKLKKILSGNSDSDSASPGYQHERHGDARVTFSQWSGDWELAAIDENYLDSEES